MNNRHSHNLKSGYALFTSIMLTGMLVLIAYATSNFSIKQLLLSGTTAESHAAFYVADTGVECALYWDLKNPSNPTKSAFDPGAPSSSVTCGGSSNAITFTGGSVAVNVAVGKTASQSSTYDGSTPASNAVDGNTGNAVYGGSLTHTGSDPNAWWQVDLGSSVSVSSVVVWGRTECCQSRLSDYWVYISSAPGGTDYAYHQTSYPNPSSTVNTPGASGRYVRIKLVGGAEPYLSLGEVQVMSIPAGGSGTSVFQIPVGTSCAIVTVTKNGTATAIESRGYNTCSGSNRLERAVRITY